MQLRIVNDLVFKALFGQEKNKQLLIHLINALLDYKKDKEITDIQILNPFGEKDFVTDKQIVLDIKAQAKNGEYYNIEMQIDPPSHYIQRIFYYLSKLFTSQLDKGKDYDTLSKTISISIIENKILFPRVKKIHTKYRMIELEEGFELSDILEMHIIELSKFEKTKPKELRSRFERWLYFLKFGDLLDKEEELPKELKQEEGIEMAYNAYKAVTRARRLRQYYEDREQWEKDYISKQNEIKRIARMEGIEEGKAEGIRITAKKMKEMGLPYDQISSITGLSKQEIEKL